jgi:hypothetical protein
MSGAMTFSIMTLSIMTFSIMTVSKMTISTMTLVPECFKAECRLIWMPSTQSVTNRLLMLSVIMLNVIMLSVFMRNVVVPNKQLRLFDLSFQTNAWNTVNNADNEYLICHNGKWACKPFKNFIYYMVLKGEYYISKTWPFDLSSLTIRMQYSD